jgi:hypothetical protein
MAGKSAVGRIDQCEEFPAIAVELDSPAQQAHGFGRESRRAFTKRIGQWVE